MPPRLMTLAICIGWIVTTGWLLHREVWPRWRADEPPPFTLYGADEVKSHQYFVNWRVYLDGKEFYHAHTSVQCVKDDIFELVANLNLKGEARDQVLGSQLHSLKSVYLVNHAGDLQQITSDIWFPNPTGQKSATPDVRFEALPRNDRLMQNSRRMVPNVRGRASEPLVPFKTEPKPFDTSVRGGCLNPLHPFSRLKGLREGQHWQTRLHNPLNEARSIEFQLAPAATGEYWWRVAKDTTALDWNDEHVVCLLVTYKGDDINIRIWVSTKDNKVLRQEADFSGEHWVMEREPD